MVTPEQSAPTIAATLSAVIIRSAAAVAAAESIHVESARTETRVLPPPMNVPASLTSDMASSAPIAISGVSDSIGPVYPRTTPIFTSSAKAGDASIINAAEAPHNFFIGSLPLSKTGHMPLIVSYVLSLSSDSLAAVKLKRASEHNISRPSHHTGY